MPQPKTPRSSSSSSRARKPAASSSRSAASKRSTSATPKATRAPAARSAQASEQAAHANLAALRDTLRRGVVLTADGIKAAMDDAVRHGRLTRKDATALTKSLVAAGRSQADGFRGDLEQVIGKGRSRATQSSSRVLREVDRARRRVGVGSSFPISLYDELNATQVRDQLTDLTRAELRKVRDYERRHANRKSVLGALERKLK
jgi:hypothetical protein